MWTLVRYPFQRGQRKERLVILSSFSHDPRSVLALVKRGNGGQCCLTHHWRRGHRFGRYEILAELGRGTMGVVYKPHDPKINRVAVKTVSLVGQPPEEEREYRQRFFREAEDAGCLESYPRSQHRRVGLVGRLRVPWTPERSLIASLRTWQQVLPEVDCPLAVQ